MSPDQAARGKVKTWVTSQWKLCASRVSSQWKSTGLGLSGDDLFYEMYEWAAGGGENLGRQAAGLCILSHLFILCDVFEK